MPIQPDVDACLDFPPAVDPDPRVSPSEATAAVSSLHGVPRRAERGRGSLQPNYNLGLRFALLEFRAGFGAASRSACRSASGACKALLGGRAAASRLRQAFW